MYERNAYNILIGKPDLKRKLGNPKNGWEDSVEMPHKGISICKSVFLLGRGYGAMAGSCR
jgi:hypothetical protein